MVVLLDTQLYIRGVTELARAERDRTAAPIPDMLRVAIVDGAMAFVVLHNHPSGNCKPSKADIELTKAIQKAAQCVDILLLDHIVMGSGEYFSFKEHNMLPKPKDDG
jgi:DNA repair protein RadC